MTRARTASLSLPFWKIAVASLLLAAALAVPALAQSDPLAQARAAGQIGEQADGYLGFVSGASVSADARARMDQFNIRRRAAYTQRAQASNVSANEMAAAVACEIFSGRIACRRALSRRKRRLASAHGERARGGAELLRGLTRPRVAPPRDVAAPC